MKILIAIFFGLVSLYDGFTTYVGTAGIMDGNIIVSLMFAIAIYLMLISTATLFGASVINNRFLKYFLRILWFIAFGYDVFTSYVGNENFLMGGYVNEQQMIILIGLTVLVSASPIIFSYFYREIF